MNKVDKIFNQSTNISEFSEKYFQYLHSILLSVNTKEIATFATLLLGARESGSKIIFMGNGGSAATASHFANDIAYGTRTFEKPFRAISITDNNAVITAVANDDGFDKIFIQQLQVVMRPGDIVVAISASGRSPNLINAIKYANKNNAITVGITAFDGGELKNTVKHSLHVPTNQGEYGPAEDAHMILDHLLGAYLTRVIL
jgi:D-sedoheptulose 7-phosphate isomerase